MELSCEWVFFPYIHSFPQVYLFLEQQFRKFFGTFGITLESFSKSHSAFVIAAAGCTVAAAAAAAARRQGGRPATPAGRTAAAAAAAWAAAAAVAAAAPPLWPSGKGPPPPPPLRSSRPAAAAASSLEGGPACKNTSSLLLGYILPICHPSTWWRVLGPQSIGRVGMPPPPDIRLRCRPPQATLWTCGLSQKNEKYMSKSSPAFVFLNSFKNKNS